jgi:hypothetical protein
MNAESPVMLDRNAPLRVSEVEVRDNEFVQRGATLFKVGDKPISSGSIARSGRKALGRSFEGFTEADVDPSCYDLQARLRLLDNAGIWAQIGWSQPLLCSWAIGKDRRVCDSGLCSLRCNENLPDLSS